MEDAEHGVLILLPSRVLIGPMGSVACHMGGVDKVIGPTVYAGEAVMCTLTDLLMEI